MQPQSSLLNISVTWRGKKFVVEMGIGANVKDLGQEMQKLTNINEDTMRFIVPQTSGRASKLLVPFSAEHALLSLQEASITEVLPFTYSVSCGLRFNYMKNIVLTVFILMDIVFIVL